MARFFIYVSQTPRKDDALPSETRGIMSEVALPGSIEPAAHKGPDLSGAINPLTGIIFGGVVAAVLLFVVYSIYSDIDDSGAKITSIAPFLLLFVALLIALGFEFVNGLHRECGRHRHLHALAASEHRGGLVGPIQPGRRARLLGRRRLRNYLAVARGINPPGR